MKAAWYTKNGAARDVLVVGELPTPTPGPGEVLVKIYRSGINPSDVSLVKRRPAFAISRSNADGICRFGVFGRCKINVGLAGACAD